MNVDNLSKAEVLMLFSILEGELEARDLVIEALRAQHRNTYTRERYGKFNLSDPFMALQRDGEALRDPRVKMGLEQGLGLGLEEPLMHPDPLTVLKLVVGHCRRMQEKMIAQLAAAESRHRRVMADLEEERRRHAEDTAEGDDVTCILEKERERLHQQLDFERGQCRGLERTQRRLQEQLEEERAQHKQLAQALARECQRASCRAQEEGQRALEAARRLERERNATQSLRAQVETEKRRALQTEARAEEQLAEVDTEKEQLRARLRREEAQSRTLQQELERLRKELEEALNTEATRGVDERAEEGEGAPASSVTSQVDGGSPWQLKQDVEEGAAISNGVHHLAQREREEEEEKEEERQNGGLENGHQENHFTKTLDPHQPQGPTSLITSPCSSPLLAKRMGSSAPSSSSAATAALSSDNNSTCLQSSYQAGIHQRFHAARHKFQGHPDGETPPQGPSPTGSPVHRGGSGSSGATSPSSPRALSPCSSPSPEASPARHVARSTVTQVLSRFTVPQQQPGGAANSKSSSTPNNSSPFGTDYRQVGPGSPSLSMTRHTGGTSGTLSPTVRSPTISRVDRGIPPPIPPKKPGLAQAPASPAPVSRAGHNCTPNSSHAQGQGHSHFTEPVSPASCGLTSAKDGVKELDMVLSSSG